MFNKHNKTSSICPLEIKKIVQKVAEEKSENLDPEIWEIMIQQIKKKFTPNHKTMPTKYINNNFFNIKNFAFRHPRDFRFHSILRR
jgi:hypothetical protein